MKTRQTTHRSILFIAGLLLTASSVQGQIGNEVRGTNSGAAITVNGDFNTIYGDEAGTALTTGDFNVFLGFEAGRLAIGSNNIFIGSQTGSTMENGEDNIFIGFVAGRDSSTPFAGSALGSDNIFIGSEAGLLNTTGYQNVFIGEEAGEGNTTGRENLFVGEDAGINADVGLRNVGVGDGACRDCGGESDSFLNTAVGADALGRTDEGWDNTAIGHASGRDIVTGFLNTTAGSNSGNNMEHADFNTFIGAYSGNDNNRTNNTANANRNTYIGAVSGPHNRNGEDNVIVGAFSDMSNIPVLSEQDVFDSLLDSSTAGSANATSLGTDRDDDVSRTTMIGSFIHGTGDDSIAIGYDSQVTGDRSIAIGSLSSATHDDSIVIGYGAVSKASNRAAIGGAATAAINPHDDKSADLGVLAYDQGSLDSLNSWIYTGVYSASLNPVADDGGSWNIESLDNGILSIQAFQSGQQSTTSTLVAFISSDGDLTIADEVSINSDRRLKKNIRPITQALSTVNQLEGKTYQWKPETRRDQDTHAGFIAQEVRAVIPEMVSRDEDGIMSINTIETIPHLIEAVKELKTSNDQQMSEYERIKAKLEETRTKHVQKQQMMNQIVKANQ